MWRNGIQVTFILINFNLLFDETCIFIGVLLLIIFRGNGQKQYQLVEPPCNTGLFFKDTAMLQMHFRQASTAIHYTINGSDPKRLMLFIKCLWY